jgi:hypothetical protein
MALTTMRSYLIIDKAGGVSSLFGARPRTGAPSLHLTSAAEDSEAAETVWLTTFP